MPPGYSQIELTLLPSGDKKMFGKWVLVMGLVCCLFQPIAAQDARVRVIPVASLQFGYTLSPDGSTAAVFENNQVHGEEVIPEFLPIRLFDLQTGEEVATLSGHTDYAIDAAFSPDGTKLASYHANGDLMVWDLAAGNPEAKRILAFAGFGRIRFLPDNRTLAVLLDAIPRPVVLWDTDSGAITTVLSQRYETYLALKQTEIEAVTVPDRTFTFEIAPDGQSLVTASMIGHVWRWNMIEGPDMQLLTSANEFPMLSIRELDYTASGESVAFFDNAAAVFSMLDAETGEQIRSVDLPEGTRAAELSPDGQTLAWTDGETLFTAPMAQPDEITSILLDTELSANPLLNIEFTPDGDRVVLGGYAGFDEVNALFVVDLRG
jgi:WD40 repeat protein